MAYLFPLLLLAGFYFVTISRRRRAQTVGAQGAGDAGDTVLIGGCIYGTLLGVDAAGVARIEVSPGVVLEVVAWTYRKVERPISEPEHDAEHDAEPEIADDSDDVADDDAPISPEEA